MTTPSAARAAAWRRRQIAGGRHFVRGRLVDTPRKKRAPHDEPPHGTRARYEWKEDRCRCTDCRAASAAAARLRRRNTKAAN